MNIIKTILGLCGVGILFLFFTSCTLLNRSEVVDDLQSDTAGAYPAISVNFRSVSEKHDILNTALSRAGGGPDLLLEMEWPQNDQNQPLSFLYQFNLADIDQAYENKQNYLPKAGLLIFFYDYDNQPWGFDPKDKSGRKVIYIPQDRLSDVVYRAPEYPIGQFWQQFYIASFGESDSAKMQFFGYPSLIQGDVMQVEAQMASNGIYMGSSISEDNMMRYEELLHGVDDWVLLFQEKTHFASEGSGEFGREYGDLGNLYFWIRKQDLAQSNFDNVWVVLQSH